METDGAGKLEEPRQATMSKEKSSRVHSAARGAAGEMQRTADCPVETTNAEEEENQAAVRVSVCLSSRLILACFVVMQLDLVRAVKPC